MLVFSKYFYLASMSSYYTFFLIQKFSLSVRDSQLHLFIFLAAIAAGTFLGGPIGDRIGRKAVIWASILGVAPFALALPYANLFWCAVLGAVIRESFSPPPHAFSRHSGLRAGSWSPAKSARCPLFFGLTLAFRPRRHRLRRALCPRQSPTSFVFQVCSYLPLIGLLTALLPNLGAASLRTSTVRR